MQNWIEINDFIGQNLQNLHLNSKTRSEIFVACEEIFVNIAKYAYINSGKLTLVFNFDTKNSLVKIIFIDSGKAFDPTAALTPDISAPVENRKIGGLGIFMAKQLMDKFEYKRENQQNILTMVKNLKPHRKDD